MAVLALSLALLCVGGVASAHAGLRNVSYRGYVVTIPTSWPVYHLTRSPRRCVRFDRHALYLGSPGPNQRCPAHAVGRTEAILLRPLAGKGARAAGSPGAAALADLGRDATSFTVPGVGVAVTATWSDGEAVVARALHRRSLPAPPRRASRPPRASSPRAAHTASAVYTGLGFDACNAPSQSDMSAWSASPYRAIGVYFGGVNAACSQPNLTSTWVAAQVADGWHLVPTYVGLQAPSNTCGCAGITPSQAAAQGAAAANDAVTDATALGIPPGNPIYDDMEGYSRSSANTQAVLAFLSAWTSQLHADGYASGVYSSGGSGITDLVAQSGTGYVEPDDIWIADWNNQQTTSDPYVPSGDWASQQRLHQYQGAHDETYGGVTINVDNDYLDGATADTTSGALTRSEPATPPAITLTPHANGTTEVSATWSGAFGVSSWRVLAGYDSTGATLASVSQAAAKGGVTRITVRNASPYFAVQAIGSSGQVLGTSPAAAMPPHVALFGPTTFAPAKGGFAAVPAGCYTRAPCLVTLTLKAGRTVVASTGNEYIGSGNVALLYYRLTPRGRVLLAHARGNRLAVQATLRDASGATAAMKLSMIAFSTSGRAPTRHLVQGSTVHVVNPTNFVSLYGVGGILTTCRNTPLCHITTTLTVGHVVIAHTGAEYLGGNEAGYLIFSLTPSGRSLLRHAQGNQLGAQLTVTDGQSSATGRISLVRFS